MNVARHSAGGVALMFSALLTACGGGGGGDASGPSPGPGTTPTTTPPVAVTASVPPSGATLAIAGEDVAAIASGSLASQGTVTVTRVPATETLALSPIDLQLTLPVDRVSAGKQSAVTLYFYSSPKKISEVGGTKRVRVLPPGLNVGKLLARVRSSCPGSPVRQAPVTWDASRSAYAAELDAAMISGFAVDCLVPLPLGSKLAAPVLLYANIFEDLTVITTEPPSLKRWPESSSNSIVAAVPGDLPEKLVPLVLVHGINVMPGQTCQTSRAFAETWSELAKNFHVESRLKDRYALYSFAYPTNVGIETNAKALAELLVANFDNRPVVLVAHSMGGLVTRSADVNSRARTTGWPDRLNIHSVITLDTPHLGTQAIYRAARRLQELCLTPGGSKGAEDLAWGGAISGEPCGNDFLCGAAGINNKDILHLKRYLPYSVRGPTLPGEVLQAIRQSSPWGSVSLSAASRQALQDLAGVSDLQLAEAMGSDAGSSNAKLSAAATGGDLAVLEASQRLQRWTGSAWVDQPALFKAIKAPYVDSLVKLNHLNVHSSQRVFTQEPDGRDGGIRGDLLGFHAEITAVSQVQFSPPEPLVGSPLVITLTAAHIAPGTMVGFPGCIAQEVTGGTMTRRQYSCTPSVVGRSMVGQINTPYEGAGNMGFAVTVLDKPAPPTPQPVAPGFLSPTNGTTVGNATPLLSWTPAAGTGSVQARAYGAPFAAANKVFESSWLAGSATSVQSTVLEPGAEYRWVVAACSGPGGSGRCTTSATASFFTAAPTIPLPRMIGSVPATMPSDNVSRPLVISGRDFTSGNVVQLLDSGGNVIYSEPPTTLLSSQLQTSIRAEFPVDVTLTIRVCRSATATSSSDCSSGPFTLTFIAVKRPDLVPRYLNNQPFAFPYTTLNVNVEVLNQGNGDAAPSQLFAKLVDSNGAIVTQGTVNVSSIAAGTTLPLTLTMPIPAPTFKTYCFSFVVDSDRRLNQSNTSNDSLSPQCFLH